MATRWPLAAGMSISGFGHAPEHTALLKRRTKNAQSISPTTSCHGGDIRLNTRLN
jgi:hypothetical protein